MRAMKNDALDALTLWEFPPEDFPRWRREFSDAVDSYEEYQQWLSGMERRAEQRGTRALRVQLTIEEMLTELAVQGARNTSENRAVIIGLVAARRRIGGL